MNYLRSLKRLAAALRYKGFRYAWNYLHYHFFWFLRHPLIIKYLYLFEPYPQYIEVEVTTRCNLRCIQCEHTYWKEPAVDMPFEKFKHIIGQFPNLKWIGLTGIGESFMHRDFIKMLHWVKERHVIVELFDTFYFIDEDIARELLTINIENFYISLDGATAQTYEKLRVGSDFKRVTENIRTFFRLKREMNLYFPEIIFHFIIHKLNYHEVPQYVDFVAEISENSGVAIFYSQMLHRYRETEDMFMKIPDEVIEEAERAGKRHGIKITWNLDVQREKPPMSRCLEWIMPFIFVTGDVIPCCVGNEANRRDFQRETSLGNIFNQSFKDIWNGRRYKELRKTLKSGGCPAPCVSCSIYERRG
ncbi:MAG: radical SAM protein [Nitrospirae bacterium YQR-1]